MSLWNAIVAILIGFIDVNPFLDLVFTPLSWAILFFS